MLIKIASAPHATSIDVNICLKKGNIKIKLRKIF